MVKTVKITTDNKISVEELPNWSLGSWEKAIGADCTETVKTQIMYDLFREPVVMIVDESGLVKNREVNAVGSFLYGIQNHGTPIVGDIIFGLQNGPDILPLADAELVKFFLKDHFPLLEEVQKLQSEKQEKAWSWVIPAPRPTALVLTVTMKQSWTQRT